MKRTTITMDGNGILSIPSNLEDLWMSEGELACNVIKKYPCKE